MPKTRQLIVVDHHEAVVLANPARTWFQVMVDHLAIGMFWYFAEECAEHARFICDICNHPSGTRLQIVRHVVHQHYLEACEACEVLTPFSPGWLGAVRTYERRTRMPWRVQAPEYD
jgi:hypothetical protein